MEQSSELTRRLRATAIRKKLMAGKPPDSPFVRILEGMSDEALLLKEEEHHKNRVSLFVDRVANKKIRTT